jgi:hypothetical protein
MDMQLQEQHLVINVGVEMQSRMAANLFPHHLIRYVTSHALEMRQKLVEGLLP